MTPYVTFDDIIHEYTNVYGVTVLSVTQLLRKHGLSPNYGAVNKDVLAHSAEVGTKRHAELQRAVESNGQYVSDDPAVRWFMENIFPRYTDWHCEQMVWIDDTANPIPVAGHIDLWAFSPETGRYIIIDFKTTASFHRESVAWQDTIYRKLWAFTNELPEDRADIAGFHAPNNGDCKFIELDPIPEETVLELMDAERDGLPFVRDTDMILSTGNQALMAEFEARILELKQIEESYKTFKTKLYDEMERNGVSNIETPSLKISLVHPSTKTTFDSKSFKTKHPDLFEEFSSTSPVKGSLRVTVK